MFDFIVTKFAGAKVTIAVTGLPVTLTGEVVNTDNDMIALKLEGGTTVYINPELIALVF